MYKFLIVDDHSIFRQGVKMIITNAFNAVKQATVLKPWKNLIKRNGIW
jgi:DNA-binding NarL/FixJ family response regulator